MSPFKNEEDSKKTGLRPDPLCLFCYPDESSTVYFGRNTYINTLPKKEPESWFRTKREDAPKTCDVEDEIAKQKDKYWLRRRTQARIRRRMKEPIRNLRSYLLTSVKNENVPPKTVLPSLFDVLETVKDAWPSPSSSKIKLLRHEGERVTDAIKKTQQPAMKDPQINIQFSSQLLNRRFSMPEELMRKYSVSKERTSEESETNKTMIEISPRSSSSSNLDQEETVRRKDTYRIETSFESSEPPIVSESLRVSEKVDAYQQTSDSDNEKSTKDLKKSQKTISEPPKRVTQYDYYNQGKKIIKIKGVEKESQVGTCTCRSEVVSTPTISAKEESEDSATSDSLPSSSPTQLPKRESSSDNMSSESSDYINCTCAEITSSKETSTDIFHSGKSTLSQTVSDKSISTQDSTVSINSVSTRGSTVSDNSNSTTPEIEKTSAKETTTSPDYSPRSPRGHVSRKFKRKDKFKSSFQDHKKSCPKYFENSHSKNYLSVNYGRQCPVHSERKTKITITCGTNTEFQLEKKDANTEVEIPKIKEDSKTNQSVQSEIIQTIKPNQQQPEEKYKWAKLSSEELYMMQQLRHKKFVESQQKLLTQTPVEPDPGSISCCGTSSVYKETSRADQPIMIPRYSALPRTLSMLVNTSSGDSFHNSDSDNQSLADSLEDQPITHVHKLYFDTKQESKPVRGDVNIVQDTKLKYRQPRGRAFFVSIKDPYGEDEMLEHIEKIPQPPEKIKNQIYERHLKICAKHKHLHEPKPSLQQPKTKTEKKRQKKRITNEKIDKNGKDETKHVARKAKEKLENADVKIKQKEIHSKSLTADEGLKSTKRKKDNKASFSSKIPVLVSSRSTSSSPERDADRKEKPLVRPKIRVRRDKKVEETGESSKPTVETTQILEITQTGKELSLQKPQAIIHPSQTPNNDPLNKKLLTMPPLVSTLGVPPPYRQTLGKQLLISQVRRSPISRFRQRFEVIPEEKSSSLSSAEEKSTKETLPKFTDVCTSPLQNEVQKPEKLEFQSYNVNEVPNLIVAKLTNKQLETLPYVKNNENQKIILFSSKDQNSNSTKGRDALIAMNREDFNRLAKGWINFYKLSETLDNSDNEETLKAKGKDKVECKTGSDCTQTLANGLRTERQPKDESKSSRGNSTEKKPKDGITQTPKCLKNSELKKITPETSSQVNLNKQKVETTPKLNEDIRFHSSNTILRRFEDLSPTDTLQNGIRQSSLPELNLYNFGDRETYKCNSFGNKLPRVSKSLDSDTDSDSTDYLEPPSPRVPPLPLADFPSDGTISSSDEIEDLKRLSNQNLKHLQIKKKGFSNRLKAKNESGISKYSKKKNSGWSVTVAGTVELSRSAPDLEMRLSFPVKGGPPVISQSDSGFAEDSNYSKQSECLQDLDFYKSKKEGMKIENMKREWMVTVKKPTQGSLQETENQPKNSSCHLPDLDQTQSKNAKKVFKDLQPELDDKMKRIIEKKMRSIWPKVQKVIKKEFLTESGRLITELYEEEDFCLSVRGNAVSLEKKQKPPTMTERDITRRYTSRNSEDKPPP